MEKRNWSIILIIAGGILVIVFALAAVMIRKNEPADPSETNMIALSEPDTGEVPGLNCDFSWPGHGRIEWNYYVCNEDGTYLIRGTTKDREISSVNICSLNEAGDTEDYEDYMRRFIREQVYAGAEVTSFYPDEALTEKITYPAYIAGTEADSDEDHVRSVGVIFSGDKFIYYYGYSCPADHYDDLAVDFDEKLNSIVLADIES
ncbi:MAG: hypothetical protein K5886_12835 [Lachnospiraceae bacterium]|nr:hypothetical protein [Lachnospiraceae bacterium]